MATINPCSGDLPGTLGEAMPSLCSGAWVTVQVTLGGTAIAITLALVVGLAASSRRRVVRGLARAFMEFFRGTSVLVLLFWVVFALPIVTGYRVTALVAGIVGLGLNLGAYGSEVVRGAVQAVPVPQREAGIALNFSPIQRMRYIVLPQAFVEMIPPMNNLLIELLKATALVSAITVTDITYWGNILNSGGLDPLIIWTTVLVMYLLFSIVITLVMRAIERRAGRMVGRTVPQRRRLSAALSGLRGGA